MLMERKGMKNNAVASQKTLVMGLIRKVLKFSGDIIFSKLGSGFLQESTQGYSVVTLYVRSVV